MPAQDALAHLRTLPGIDPFSAELILIRGAGPRRLPTPRTPTARRDGTRLRPGRSGRFDQAPPHRHQRPPGAPPRLGRPPAAHAQRSVVTRHPEPPDLPLPVDNPRIAPPGTVTPVRAEPARDICRLLTARGTGSRAGDFEESPSNWRDARKSFARTDCRDLLVKAHQQRRGPLSGTVFATPEHLAPTVRHGSARSSTAATSSTDASPEPGCRSPRRQLLGETATPDFE